MKRNENPVATTVTTCPVKKKSRFKEELGLIDGTIEDLANVLLYARTKKKGEWIYLKKQAKSIGCY